jgi:hypothetical protein
MEHAASFCPCLSGLHWLCIAGLAKDPENYLRRRDFGKHIDDQYAENDEDGSSHTGPIQRFCFQVIEALFFQCYTTECRTPLAFLNSGFEIQSTREASPWRHSPVDKRR